LPELGHRTPAATAFRQILLGVELADERLREPAADPAAALLRCRRRDDHDRDDRREENQEGERGAQAFVPVSTSKKRVSRSRSVKSIGATSFAKSAR
jgi:hypothetical protein